MTHVTHGRLSGPVARFRRTISEAEGLPFASLMDRRDIEQTLQAFGVWWKQAVFTPLVTLYAFVSQTLDADGSCRATVARVLAWRIGRGERACSARTGGYCQARARLSEAALAALMQRIGRRLCPSRGRASADGDLLGGRPIRIVDGSTVSMPDTPANQRTYPQALTQKPGLGFPVARMVVLFCLHSGAVLDAAIGPYKGKRTGENALFRRLFGDLRAGDVVVGDCYFGSFWNLAMLAGRGVDAVFPLHQRRPEDFRRGRRLGREDRLVEWRKPAQRPDWMDRRTYQRMPDTLTLCQVRVHIDVPGFRTRTMVLVTTLTDPRNPGTPEPRNPGTPASIPHKNWPKCTAPAGTRNWTCAPSSARCGWTCCEAKARP